MRRALHVHTVLVTEDWDRTYEERGATGVSWYEPTPRTSLEILAELDVALDAPVIDIGGGASGLADELVALGYTDVTVLDVSEVALGAARERSGMTVTWLHQDVLTWRPERAYGLWHDRAVLHFFTEEPERRAYRRTLDAAVAPGGYVVLATFAPDGPTRCSGLPVRRYSPADLGAFLGDEYTAVMERRHDHVTPRGAVQPFTWGAFRRREAEPK